MQVKLKRAYDPPEPSDGFRVLVDRLWPRGISKEKAKLDLWLKEIAPSAGLRKWFGHEPEKWDEFKKRYFSELEANPETVLLLKNAVGGKETLTFVMGLKIRLTMARLRFWNICGARFSL